VGLANTRARLSALYGASHRFELDSRRGEGLTVRISLPLRSAEPGSGGE
jgi:sensor histidine kinase YesM